MDVTAVFITNPNLVILSLRVLGCNCKVLLMQLTIPSFSAFLVMNSLCVVLPLNTCDLPVLVLLLLVVSFMWVGIGYDLLGR